MEYLLNLYITWQTVIPAVQPYLSVGSGRMVVYRYFVSDYMRCLSGHNLVN